MLKLWLLLGCFSLYMFLGSTIDLQPQCFKVDNPKCPNSNISFWLYTKKYSKGLLLDPLDLGHFRFAPKPLKVLIHGLSGNRDSPPNAQIRPKLLLLPGINLISVDYGKLTPDPCYTESVHNLQIVSRCLAELLVDLTSFGYVRPHQIHLIGFGLGAHGAAFTANQMEALNTRVKHITALNPSKAMFLTPELSKRLDSSDADFVDVIHTDIFVNGIMQPVGHVDFYPNKGLVQPGCGPPDNIDTHDCYQNRAADYYAESINSRTKFWAFKCKDLYGFVKGECRPNNNVEQLGYHTRRTARGNYFLATNNKPPYARGRNFTNMDRDLAGKTFMPTEVIKQLGELKAARDLTTHI